MKKCIDCAYFIGCDKSNEENVCDRYKFIRQNIKLCKQNKDNYFSEYEKEEIRQLLAFQKKYHKGELYE